MKQFGAILLVLSLGACAGLNEGQKPRALETMALDRFVTRSTRSVMVKNTGTNPEAVSLGGKRIAVIEAGQTLHVDIGAKK